jgi:hypothetical protein
MRIYQIGAVLFLYILHLWDCMFRLNGDHSVRTVLILNSCHYNHEFILLFSGYIRYIDIIHFIGQGVMTIFMCVIPVVCVTSKEGGVVKRHN